MTSQTTVGKPALVGLRKPSIGSVVATTIGLYAIPVLLCAIDRFAFGYPIGPVVLVYSVVVLLISLPLYYLVSLRLGRLIAVVLSVATSVLSSVLVLNVFFALTVLFGVNDFELM